MSRRKKEKIFVNNYILLPSFDFYTKSRLQDILSRPSQYFANVEIKNFDIIYHDLYQKELDYPLKHYQTIFKDSFKVFDKDVTGYLLTHARRSKRNNIFFEKEFERGRFLKKDPHIFLSTMKKKFYYKKLKVTTTDNTNLNF